MADTLRKSHHYDDDDDDGTVPVVRKCNCVIILLAFESIAGSTFWPLPAREFSRSSQVKSSQVKYVQ